MKASNEEKQKSIRPLKAKLAELERRIKALSESVRNCVEAVKKKGANSITDDFMAEAERLSAEKRTVELEKTKVQLDINYRESVVADKHIIAEALLQFDQVVRSLPAEDQKELLQLIVREISVKQFDPQTDPLPKEKGVFSAKIRTKWHLVNISFYASDLIPDNYKTGKKSDSKKIGSRGRTRTYNHTVNSRVLYH